MFAVFIRIILLDAGIHERLYKLPLKKKKSDEQRSHREQGGCGYD